MSSYCYCSCSHCQSPLKEDAPELGVDTGAIMFKYYSLNYVKKISIAIVISFRLNEQLKPIVDLLRETENITLAPEVLEPTPQSIKKV